MGTNTTKTNNTTKASTPNDTGKKAKDEVQTRVVEYLEGTIDLLPNVAIKCKSIYYLTGLGGVFNGNYYFRKVTYTLNSEGLAISGEVIKAEKVNYFKSEAIYDNRPDRTPAPPAKKQNSNNGLKYITINRQGITTAVSGLHARKGTPFGLQVNAQGYVVSDVSKAPAVGIMKKGYKLKVYGEQGAWYRTSYKGGSWSYKRFIKLL